MVDAQAYPYDDHQALMLFKTTQLLLLFAFDLRAFNQFQKSFQRQASAPGMAQERAAQGRAFGYTTMGACRLMR